MKSNFIVKCKQDGIHARIYMLAFRATYWSMTPVVAIISNLPLQIVQKICVALERKSNVAAQACHAARDAGESREVRGYLCDIYDIASDMHAEVHNIILNKFGVEPCRA